MKQVDPVAGGQIRNREGDATELNLLMGILTWQSCREQAGFGFNPRCRCGITRSPGRAPDFIISIFNIVQSSL